MNSYEYMSQFEALKREKLHWKSFEKAEKQMPKIFRTINANKLRIVLKTSPIVPKNLACYGCMFLRNVQQFILCNRKRSQRSS